MSSGRLQEVKNNDNYNAVSSKSGRSRLREVPTIGLRLGKIVLYRWSLTGGGRLRSRGSRTLKFNCIQLAGYLSSKYC